MARSPRYQVPAQLSYTKHAELIRLLESEPKGSVQRIVIAALEAYYKLPPSQRRDPIKQLAADMTAIRRLIESQPTLEQIQVMLDQITVVEGVQAAPLPQKVPVATDEELAKRRANRLKNPY
jgi:hypothetical protein